MIKLLDAVLHDLSLSMFFVFVVVCFLGGFFGHMERHAGILVPRPGMEPVPPAMEAQRPNLWTAGEVPQSCSLLLE